MRILFTFIGGSGHFHPLVPVARAAQAAGHTVAVAGGGTMVTTIEEAGFTAFATSPPRPRRAPDHGPLEPADPAGEARHLREGFAGTGARRHAAVLPGIVARWRPDLLVRDEVDFGAAIVAELLGLPCATVLVLAAGTFLRPEIVAEPLHELRAEKGLPPDPALTMLERGLVLSPFAPSFRSPAAPLPPTAFSYRATAGAPARAATTRPTVYFTLGTIYTHPELHTRVLTGLRDLPADIIMTVGEHIDPAGFGPQPAHVRIERFIPQDELLPRCDLVVSHGGSGSMIGTLTHGLPAVLLPMGADQPHNAARCVELGVGRALDPITVTPDEVRQAVSAVLAEPGYRRAAARIQTEISTLPPVAATVAALERLRG
ncbi:glycosyl transferase [Longispora fulva]|uniref:UDP:flavonoid glycosyltransferase YjiC (YdhE family) n=1 Tax=Longispora fulva TaxID=619741 RepID=A0A8J7GS48_9ACTN|nr:glycosyltransferase [Longispora fulva]MBG6136006.1 UDP:flavonoid glycosyltransferase YjiC (YdhE family) [Longispora fulva]GIG55753.1 glycosyl transferase [Longispora fulva]